MERKALLILHGKQAAHQALREAVMSRREDGWDLAVRVTWEGGDAERYVDEALSLGYRTIVAAGGDGSVRDITQAMMASVLPFISMGPRAPGSVRFSRTASSARPFSRNTLSLIHI